MSTRSGTLAQKALAVESVKRKLDFDELRDRGRREAEFPRTLTWRKKKGRRLDFGETDPLVRLTCPDLLPDRCDSDLVIVPPQRERRTLFSAEQKATLETTFRGKKFLTRKEKATLAAKLDVSIVKVQNWFKNRRRKWRKEQKKGTVGPSGFRPILPGAYMIETSCKQSFKSTVSFDGLPQFPAQKQMPSQPLCWSQFLAISQPASTSQQMTQLHAASSSLTKLDPEQNLPGLPPSSIKEIGSLPFQQGHPLQPGPGHRISQHQLQSSQLVQHKAAPLFPARGSLPLVNPVEQDIHQLNAVQPKRLFDEFPFSNSTAKELPNIFGNLQESQILNRPLTPAFDTPPDCDLLWDILALESDQTKENQSSSRNENFVERASPNYRRVQPSRLNSCCFGNSHSLSSPPLEELSCGFISKGRSFRFFRQD